MVVSWMFAALPVLAEREQFPTPINEPSSAATPTSPAATTRRGLMPSRRGLMHSRRELCPAAGDFALCFAIGDSGGNFVAISRGASTAPTNPQPGPVVTPTPTIPSGRGFRAWTTNPNGVGTTFTPQPGITAPSAAAPGAATQPPPTTWHTYASRRLPMPRCCRKTLHSGWGGGWRRGRPESAWRRCRSFCSTSTCTTIGLPAVAAMNWASTTSAWHDVRFSVSYNPQTPLLVTPGFAVHYWDGPVSMPPAAAGRHAAPDVRRLSRRRLESLDRGVFRRRA